MDRDELSGFLNRKIYHWVGRNFGSQEAEDPSWNIEELSAYLGKELDRELHHPQPRDPYELTVLTRTGGDWWKTMEDIIALVERHGGEVVKKENDGDKRLAYSINGEDFATYLYFEIRLPKDAPVKISTALNIKDDVLRYLLVKQDTRRR